jgi:dihydrofolate reductase
LILSAFLTLDGVMEGPGFDEHRDGRNAWALRRQDPENQVWNKEQVMAADALLVGRVTYQIWAAFWPTAGGDNEFAARMNEISKYVVSRTLHHLDWNNTTILSGDPAAEVEGLKARVGGELILYGSADLANEVMAHELIDEYRLQVFPVVLGSGKHLFADGIDLHHLNLVSTRTFPSGVVLLTYVPEHQEPTSPYLDEYAWTDEQTRSLQAAQNADRILATVLFTGIVDSTARAAAMGDRAWRQLVDRQYEVARAEANRWAVQHIESTGDGIMALRHPDPRAALRVRAARRDGGPGARDPGGRSYRRDRAARAGGRRHRRPHRGAGARAGRAGQGACHPHRARPDGRDRSGLPAHRFRQLEGGSRGVGAAGGFAGLVGTTGSLAD